MNRAVRREPRCKYPVGEGAKRVRQGVSDNLEWVVASAARREEHEKAKRCWVGHRNPHRVHAAYSGLLERPIPLRTSLSIFPESYAGDGIVEHLLFWTSGVVDVWA